MSAPSVLEAIKKVHSLLTREEKIKWLGIVAFAVCTSLFEVLTATLIVLFAQVLNQPTLGQKYFTFLGIKSQLSAGHMVFYIALAVGGIYLIKNLIASAEVFYQNFSIQKMNYHFKNRLLHRYAEADYAFYLTRNSSLGSSVVSGDAEHLFSGGMTSLACILSEGLVFFCLISMVMLVNPSVALTIFVIGIILATVISKILLPKFYRFGQRLQEAQLYSGQNLSQFFHAFKEIVLLGKRDAFVNAYRYHSRKKSRIHALQTAINSLPRMAIEVIFVGLFVITVAILCLEHESPTQMMGILGGYLYVGFRLMPGLNRIINQLNVFKFVIPSIERVYDEYTTISSKENYIDVPGFNFKRSINLKKVCFHYFNVNKDALSQISLDIKKGEYIGIIGETGSGKSTLVDVILGLLKPQAGSIFIDNKYPVNSYQWHQRIGYVPQSVYLIDDSIEANIAFGEKKIDEEKLTAAIDVAQLRKFINNLPQGAKTIVGERGIRLSGGERQRISIARALYRNPEILIFDEATSALDNETEERLMQTINNISQNRTVIMVAHRLTTLKNCDRIIVMENGSIKEITSYDNIQPRKVKRYAKN
ncbi:MAG: ABC transporter ATP-binding protein [Alphaproteobacteria bacterium]|nr:ABC transporter ATP-binding protein [Alphaproteobacteria bacterium]